jgi:hypothetical protein
MHPKSIVRHADVDLVLERLPSGELGQLLASPGRRNYWVGSRPALTQRGLDVLTRERAMEALFGRGWPTVVEVCRS